MGLNASGFAGPGRRLVFGIALYLLASLAAQAEQRDWAAVAADIHQRINTEPEAVLSEIDPLIQGALDAANTAAALDLLADKVWAARLVARYDTAIAAAERGIRIATKVADRQRLANLYNNLGGVYWSLQDYSSAMDFWTRAMKLRESLNDTVGLAKSLNNIALIYQERGDYPKARQWMHRSLQTALKLGSDEMLVVLYGNLGDIETELGNYDAAARYYNQAEQLAEKLNDRRARVVLAVSRARLALKQSQAELARQWLDAAWQWTRDLGNRRKEVEILRLYAELAEREQRPQDALEHLLLAERLAEQSGRTNDLIEIQEQLARIYAGQGQWRQAYEHLRKEVDLSNRWLEQQKQNTLLRMQSRFDWETQKRNLELLKSRQALLEHEHERDTRERRLLLAAVLFFASLVVVLGVVLWLKMRLNVIVQAKNRELEDIRKVLQEQARIDPLTRLYNRRAFMEKVEQEMRRMQRTGRSAGLALLDLDHFKQINDRYGHMAGDMILQGVAARMRTSLREVDILARWGGEEFIVLMPDTDLPTAIQAAERLRKFLSSKPYTAGQQKIPLTVTIGVTAIRPDCTRFRDAYNAADEALYRGKTSGRNQVVSQSCIDEEKPSDNR